MRLSRARNQAIRTNVNKVFFRSGFRAASPMQYSNGRFCKAITDGFGRLSEWLQRIFGGGSRHKRSPNRRAPSYLFIPLVATLLIALHTSPLIRLQSEEEKVNENLRKSEPALT